MRRVMATTMMMMMGSKLHDGGEHMSSPPPRCESIGPAAILPSPPNYLAPSPH